MPRTNAKGSAAEKQLRRKRGAARARLRRAGLPLDDQLIERVLAGDLVPERTTATMEVAAPVPPMAGNHVLGTVSWRAYDGSTVRVSLGDGGRVVG